MNIKAWLSGILTLQLLLAAGLLWGNLQTGGENLPEPLLDFDTARVNRIVIEDNGNRAVLHKARDEWELPELHGLPGAGARIEGFLATLKDVTTRYPVATTSSAQDRFEVAPDNFQRHAQLYEGETLLGEYYFGTSPGFRQTHGRRAQEDAVYSLPINNFDMPGDNNDWLDKTLLAVSDPVRISGPDYTLEKAARQAGAEVSTGESAGEANTAEGAGDGAGAEQDTGDGAGGSNEESWNLAPVEEATAEVDRSEVDTLVSALENLRVLRVADETPDESGAVEVTVETASESFHYRFMKNEEDNRYYVARDDREPVFTLSRTAYDNIAGKTREQLVSAPAEEEEADATQEEQAADSVESEAAQEEGETDA